MVNEIKVQQKQGINTFLQSDAVKHNIMSVVGEKDSQRFISSVVSAVQSNPQLADCSNSSILSAALLGHSLKLPQSPQLQMFYLVPFNNTKKVKDENGREKEIKVKEAVFQLSYRGYLQLAMRSGQYRKINACDIREGELKSFNPITEEYVFEAITDYEKRKLLPVVGYYAYFEMNNGYRKELYWSKEQMDAHAKRYSMAYRKGWSSSFWASDFDAMALKTMLRQLISKWGMMSVDMETAYQNDMAIEDENGNPVYVDNVSDGPEKAVDVYADVVAESVADDSHEG
jgi:recombination protein RecT